MKKVLLPLGLIIIFTAVVIGVLLLVVSNQQDESVGDEVNNINNDSNQIYVNDEFGYKIAFPKTWSTRDVRGEYFPYTIEPGTEIGIENAFSVSSNSEKDFGSPAVSEAEINFSVDVYEKRNETLSEQEIKNIFNLSEVNTETFNNLEFYISVDNYTSTDVEVAKIYIKNYFVFNEGYLYNISFYNKSEQGLVAQLSQIEEILATFDFVDIEKDTAGLLDGFKYYNNPEKNYTIQYPENYYLSAVDYMENTIKYGSSAASVTFYPKESRNQNFSYFSVDIESFTIDSRLNAEEMVELSSSSECYASLTPQKVILDTLAGVYYEYDSLDCYEGTESYYTRAYFLKNIKDENAFNISITAQDEDIFNENINVAEKMLETFELRDK